MLELIQSYVCLIRLFCCYAWFLLKRPLLWSQEFRQSGLLTGDLQRYKKNYLQYRPTTLFLLSSAVNTGDSVKIAKNRCQQSARPRRFLFSERLLERVERVTKVGH